MQPCRRGESSCGGNGAVRIPAKIIEALKNFDLDEVKRELEESDAGTQPQLDENLVWLDEQRKHLIFVFEQVDSPEDRDMLLAINFIELKSRWIAFNTELNYQVFKKGAPDVATQQRAFGTSLLLATVEPLLSSGDVDQITQFLAEPVNRAA